MGGSKSKQKQKETTRKMRFHQDRSAEDLKETVRRSVQSPSTFTPKKRSERVQQPIEPRPMSLTGSHKSGKLDWRADDGSGKSMAERYQEARKSSRKSKLAGPPRRLTQSKKSYSDSSMLGMDIPPPPPLPSSSSSSSPPSPSTPCPSGKADATFLDYTVVPLLLRSGLGYTKAQLLGERLKTYTQAEVDEIMSGPEKLLEFIEAEDVAVPPSFATRLETDKVWEDMKTARRKSYVYFRSDPNARKSMHRVRHQSTASTSSTKRRSEFRQEMTPHSGQVPEFSEADLAKLMSLSKQNKSMKNMVKAFYTA